MMQQLTARWTGTAGTPLGGVLRMAARGAGAAVVALAVAALHDVHDPGALCPLRRFTGIPCPGCGSTTVFIEAGHGAFGAALLANPVTVVVGLGLLVAPLGPGRWWWQLPNLHRNVLIGTALTVSWLWQLHRFGVVLP
ncbi:hypothetical protein F4556_004333 [Kitasatospora gansuensis]|uniref:DUF2752 domain-containing protein n=2 Tax=Kitasatospora gansuensis TaxID=258050 RepID=A0A7W7SE73_9ACTN|nr:hypothetical protein [Kitasatospora gansuensis]